tara:strand:- start:795 stop:1163 length:369 start_codon:yes stop_codon:yes gene_type:complete
MTEEITSENFSNNISFVEDLDAYKSISKHEIISHNDTYNTMITKTKHSLPYLTKFERCKLIGIRAEQLTNINVSPMVEIKKTDDVVDIAERELRERKIPFIIRRYFSNGEYEDWKISEFIKI